MSRESPPFDDVPGEDIDAFDEWLAETAASKGVSKREVVDQLLSSYWIVSELSDMADEPGNVGPSETDRDAGPDDGAGDGGPTAPDGTAHAGEDGDPETEEILQAVRAVLERRSEGGDPSDDPETEGVAGKSPKRSQPGRPAPADGSGTDLEVEVERLRQRQEEIVEKLSNDLQRMQGRLETAATDAERAVPEPAFDRALADLEAELAAVREGHADLEGYIEAEFDSIEGAFRTVLDRIDDVATQVASLSEAYHDEFETIEDARRERERLASLRREALREGVTDAVCAGCGQEVALGMLDAPACPECRRPFVGIETGGWNPFRAPRLETDPDAGPADDGPPSTPGDPSDPTDR